MAHQAGTEFMVLQPLPPNSWDYWHVPPCPTLVCSLQGILYIINCLQGIYQRIFKILIVAENWFSKDI
jgi:hypothetical protein